MTASILVALLALLALTATTVSGQTQSYSFCYYVLGTANNGFSVSASGTIVTSSTAVTVNNRTAYAIVNVTGSRTYTDSNGGSSTNIITGLKASDSNFTIDNYLYTSWPYVDQSGLLYTVASTPTPLTANGAVTVPEFRLWIDAVNTTYGDYIARIRVNEDAITSNTVTDSTGGDLVVTLDNGASASTIAATQCSNNVGDNQSYDFCFYQSGTTGGVSWSITTSGTFTTNGPVTRRSRPSRIINAITGGTRVLTDSARNGSITQHIAALRSINSVSTTEYAFTDNVLYTDAPYLDDMGFVYQLDSQAAYPNNTASTSNDVQIYVGDVTGAYVELTGDWKYFELDPNARFVYSSSVSASTMAAQQCRVTGSNAVNAASSVSVSLVAVLAMLALVLTLTTDC